MSDVLDQTDKNSHCRSLEGLSKPLKAHQSRGKLKKLALKSSYIATLRAAEENLEAALESLRASNRLPMRSS